MIPRSPLHDNSNGNLAASIAGNKRVRLSPSPGTTRNVSPNTGVMQQQQSTTGISHQQQGRYPATTTPELPRKIESEDPARVNTSQVIATTHSAGDARFATATDAARITASNSPVMARKGVAGDPDMKPPKHSAVVVAGEIAHPNIPCDGNAMPINSTTGQVHSNRYTNSGNYTSNARCTSPSPHPLLIRSQEQTSNPAVGNLLQTHQYQSTGSFPKHSYIITEQIPWELINSSMGINLELCQKTQTYLVTRVGLKAQVYGVRQGDYLYAVNGCPATQFTPTQTGSTVEMSFVRVPSPEPQESAVSRDKQAITASLHFLQQRVNVLAMQNAQLMVQKQQLDAEMARSADIHVQLKQVKLNLKQSTKESEKFKKRLISALEEVSLAKKREREARKALSDATSTAIDAPKDNQQLRKYVQNANKQIETLTAQVTEFTKKDESRLLKEKDELRLEMQRRVKSQLDSFKSLKELTTCELQLEFGRVSKKLFKSLILPTILSTAKDSGSGRVQVNLPRKQFVKLCVMSREYPYTNKHGITALLVSSTSDDEQKVTVLMKYEAPISELSFVANFQLIPNNT